MFNDFILNNVTAAELMELHNIAQEHDLELSEHNGTVALFENALHESVRYEVPIAEGVLNVALALAGREVEREATAEFWN